MTKYLISGFVSLLVTFLVVFIISGLIEMEGAKAYVTALLASVVLNSIPTYFINKKMEENFNAVQGIIIVVVSAAISLITLNM